MLTQPLAEALAEAEKLIAGAPFIASEQDLAEHFRTPHIADFRAAVAPYARVDRSLHRYFIASSEDFESAKVV